MNFAAFWCRCKILACEVRAWAESKISRRHSSLDFYFSLSLLPSFFAFLDSFFCSLAGHLVGFILVGNVLRKIFRILGLNERKGRWVVEQDLHGNFRVNVTWFFDFFSDVLDWIELILVWFERSLHSAQVNGQSYLWLLIVNLLTSQAVERTRIRTGGYERLRGECVNKQINANVYRHSLWKYSKRFHCSFEWHYLTPHKMLSIETCIRRTPCFKRTLQHSPSVSA